MDKATYKKEVKKVKQAVYGTSFEEITNLGLLGTFSLVSANILRYLKVNDQQHYKLIQDIQFHRTVSNIDQYCMHTLDELKVHGENQITTDPGGKGQIYVTFHTGSFRLFIQHLNRKGLPFCLVTEGQYIKDQGEVTQALFKQVNGENRGLEILEAENPKLLFELLRKINSGISVVFYIDGNTGVSEKNLADNKNLLKIDFLQADIYARQGIAMLAYLSKAQIVLALAKRNKNLSNTISLKRIPTGNFKKYSRNDFVNTVTKSMFDHLGYFLRKYPEQWEGWFYIQKFFSEHETVGEQMRAQNSFANVAEILIGVDQYVQLLKYDEDNVFIIKKRDYQVMKITPLLYDVLAYFKIPQNVVPNQILKINEHEVPWEFVEELLEMKFLAA